MARIVYFSDDAALASVVQQRLSNGEHEIYILPASKLTSDLREIVRRIAPMLILMDMMASFDNIPMFLFLRSDYATRATPVIMLANSMRYEQDAAMLGADGFVSRPALAEELLPTVQLHMPRERALAA
jgi:DNA-binding response OmpR family regulator